MSRTRARKTPRADSVAFEIVTFQKRAVPVLRSILLFVVIVASVIWKHILKIWMPSPGTGTDGVFEYVLQEDFCHGRTEKT